jgi:hypothetical protein
MGGARVTYGASALFVGRDVKEGVMSEKWAIDQQAGMLGPQMSCCGRLGHVVRPIGGMWGALGAQEQAHRQQLFTGTRKRSHKLVKRTPTAYQPSQNNPMVSLGPSVACFPAVVALDSPKSRLPRLMAAYLQYTPPAPVLASKTYPGWPQVIGMTHSIYGLEMLGDTRCGESFMGQ